MNSGTRRRDEVFTELGVLVIAGLETWAGGVRTAVLVRVADGPDRAGSVTVEDEGLCVTELVEVVGVRNVGAVAPTQPATTNASAVAPTRKRAAYRRACLT
jgi:hypothetical protein